MERTVKIAFVIMPITIVVISTILVFHLITNGWHDLSTAMVLRPIIELGLEKQFFMVVHGVAWIGVATVLGATAIWSIRRIGRMIGLPVDEMFEEVKTVLGDKLDTMKNGKGKQEPFRFSMWGLKMKPRDSSAGSCSYHCLALLPQLPEPVSIIFGSSMRFRAVCMIHRI